MFSIGFASTALCEPQLNLVNKYYTVEGQTPREIRRSLDQNSRAISQGQKFEAKTEWHVRWRFWWKQSPELCTISRVKTEVDVSMTLPKLDYHPGLPHHVIERWDNYIKALTRHEHQHKDFGIAAAKEIELALKALKPRPDCTELEQEANALAKQIIQHYAQKERQFDADTQHGTKHGAIFP